MPIGQITGETERTETKECVRDYRCDTCGKKIPKGAPKFTLRYKGTVLYHQIHTDCKEYETQETLPPRFNWDWRKRQVTYDRVHAPYTDQTF